MDNVVVLLSTYNGEKFLREQIDSVLNQKDVNVQIIVRDDGSSDATIDILNEYKQSGKIVFYTGENKRTAQSFMDLVYSKYRLLNRIHLICSQSRHPRILLQKFRS